MLLIGGFVCNAPRAAAESYEVPVVLGQAGLFSVLSGAGVTSTGATVVSADLGANTAISVVGFPPGVVNGVTHVGDTISTQALTDLTSAYNNAAGRAAANPLLAGDLNGRTFTPGVYRAEAAIALTGTVTLDAENQPNAVFVFQLGAAFNPAASSTVNLINGASASNVFWQVVGATTIGASASLTGTILTTAAISIGANATLTGRALSTNGTITLAANTISTPPLVTITGGSVASTNVTSPTIAGTTDALPGTELTVTFAGQTMIATIAAGGAWTVTAAKVPKGSYRVSASLTGPEGNTSTARQTLNIGGIPPVALGRAGSFSVLSGAGVTSTGATVVSADLGANTAISVVGFPPGVVNGSTHIGDTISTEALADLTLAYNDAAARTTANPLLTGDLNGRTFTPGVYRADAAIALTGTVTLDAENQPNAVFVFQLGAAFNPAASSTVNLINGASTSNVFWQVVGATTIAASASMRGTILTTAAISIGANATLTGRALSTNGTITLADNTITAPEVSAGTLSITTSTAVDLGTFATQAGGRTITGPLGQVYVVDTRSGSSGSGWVASVSATAFTHPSGPPILATSIRYSPGTVTKVRGPLSEMVTYAPNDLTASTQAVRAIGASGDNAAAATWNPTLTVDIPETAVAGIYTSTVTYTVV